eukprot:m.67960 g.67960  ORF g.67960 m.67960 type:complete len:1248 (+) comp11925_c0_seq3:291-4034(+)
MNHLDVWGVSIISYVLLCLVIVAVDRLKPVAKRYNVFEFAKALVLAGCNLAIFIVATDHYALTMNKVAPSPSGVGYLADRCGSQTDELWNWPMFFDMQRGVLALQYFASTVCTIMSLFCCFGLWHGQHSLSGALVVAGVNQVMLWLIPYVNYHKDENKKVWTSIGNMYYASLVVSFLLVLAYMTGSMIKHNKSSSDEKKTSAKSNHKGGGFESEFNWTEKTHSFIYRKRTQNRIFAIIMCIFGYAFCRSFTAEFRNLNQGLESNPFTSLRVHHKDTEALDINSFNITRNYSNHVYYTESSVCSALLGEWKEALTQAPCNNSDATLSIGEYEYCSQFETDYKRNCELNHLSFVVDFLWIFLILFIFWEQNDYNLAVYNLIIAINYIELEMTASHLFDLREDWRSNPYSYLTANGWMHALQSVTAVIAVLMTGIPAWLNHIYGATENARNIIEKQRQWVECFAIHVPLIIIRAQYPDFMYYGNIGVINYIFLAISIVTIFILLRNAYVQHHLSFSRRFTSPAFAVAEFLGKRDMYRLIHHYGNSSNLTKRMESSSDGESLSTTLSNIRTLVPQTIAESWSQSLKLEDINNENKENETQRKSADSSISQKQQNLFKEIRLFSQIFYSAQLLGFVMFAALGYPSCKTDLKGDTVVEVPGHVPWSVSLALSVVVNIASIVAYCIAKHGLRGCFVPILSHTEIAKYQDMKFRAEEKLSFFAAPPCPSLPTVLLFCVMQSALALGALGVWDIPVLAFVIGTVRPVLRVGRFSLTNLIFEVMTIVLAILCVLVYVFGEDYAEFRQNDKKPRAWMLAIGPVVSVWSILAISQLMTALMYWDFSQYFMINDVIPGETPFSYRQHCQNKVDGLNKQKFTELALNIDHDVNDDVQIFNYHISATFDLKSCALLDKRRFLKMKPNLPNFATTTFLSKMGNSFFGPLLIKLDTFSLAHMAHMTMSPAMYILAMEIDGYINSFPKLETQRELERMVYKRMAKNAWIVPITRKKWNPKERKEMIYRLHFLHPEIFQHNDMHMKQNILDDMSSNHVMTMLDCLTSQIICEGTPEVVEYEESECDADTEIQFRTSVGNLIRKSSNVGAEELRVRPDELAAANEYGGMSSTNLPRTGTMSRPRLSNDSDRGGKRKVSQDTSKKYTQEYNEIMKTLRRDEGKTARRQQPPIPAASSKLEQKQQTKWAPTLRKEDLAKKKEPTRQISGSSVASSTGSATIPTRSATLARRAYDASTRRAPPYVPPPSE